MDEGQNRVSKELVKFKVFNSKEEAEEWKGSYKGKDILSDVVSRDKKFFVARSKVGDILARSVNVAGKYLELNVPLTAGWQVGSNWAECH